MKKACVLLFASPGDYLKPGEEEVNGLKARLDDRLAPPAGSYQFGEQHGVDNDWEIGDCLAQWWRPNFETFMVSPNTLLAFPSCHGGQCSPLYTSDVHSLVGTNNDDPFSLRLFFHASYSTHSYLHILPNPRSARNYSSYRCQNAVRSLLILLGSEVDGYLQRCSPSQRI